MANTPQFAAVAETSRAQCTVAYADRAGTPGAGLVELLVAGSGGTKVTQIVVKSTGNSTAGLVLVFITDTSGNNARLFDEIPFAAATPNASVPSARAVAIYDDLQLKSGQKILVGSTTVTSAVNVLASKGDF